MSSNIAWSFRGCRGLRGEGVVGDDVPGVPVRGARAASAAPPHVDLAYAVRLSGRDGAETAPGVTNR
jgi:hypothetical protein